MIYGGWLVTHSEIACSRQMYTDLINNRQVSFQFEWSFDKCLKVCFDSSVVRKYAGNVSISKFRSGNVKIEIYI